VNEEVKGKEEVQVKEKLVVTEVGAAGQGHRICINKVDLLENF